MKKLGFFLLGVFVGAILAIFIIGAFKASKSKRISYFDEPKETITFINSTGEEEAASTFRVIGSIENGMAIAVCTQVQSYDLVVLLCNVNGEQYYDNQIVNAPNNKVFKQVGVYNSISKDGPVAVPVVKIADKPQIIKMPQMPKRQH